MGFVGTCYCGGTIVELFDGELTCDACGHNFRFNFPQQEEAWRSKTEQGPQAASEDEGKGNRCPNCNNQTLHRAVFLGRGLWVRRCETCDFSGLEPPR